MDRHPDPVVGYDEDFVRWAERQVAVLHARDVAALDVDNLIEELEGQVRSSKRELRHRLRVIIVHLLKCQHQPQRKSRSWSVTLIEQRGSIQSLLSESPSLRRLLSEYAEDEYALALRRAAAETNLDESAFPPALPYSPEQLLDKGFEPETVSGSLACQGISAL
jgi:hypothetical protein